MIFLSLKSAKQPGLDMAYRMIEEQIAGQAEAATALKILSDLCLSLL